MNPLKHLNNQKCSHNKGLCKKNEYCEGSFIVSEIQYFGLAKMHNAHEISHVVYLLTMWLQFKK